MAPPTLADGSGDWTAFNAYVAGLGQTGVGRYSTRKPLARWRAVPYRTITGDDYIGVFSVHGAGMSRVRFSLNGGAFSDVSAMTAHPVTGKWAYWVKVDGAALADSAAHEVRAIAEPNKGYARVFSGAIDTSFASAGEGEHSLFFAANPGATLTEAAVYADAVNGDDGTGDGSENTPFQSLAAAVTKLHTDSHTSGGRVILFAGTYNWPQWIDTMVLNERLLRVERHGTAAVGMVIIGTSYTTNYQGCAVKLLHLSGIKITASLPLGQATDVTNYTPPLVWLEDCERDGSVNGAAEGCYESNYGRGVYITGGSTHHMIQAMNGQRHIDTHEIHHITEDALREPKFAIDVYNHDHGPDNPLAHPDTCQFFEPTTGDHFANIIVWNYRCRAIGTATDGVQGPFVRNYSTVGTYDGLAFGNCDLHYGSHGDILHSANHVILWHNNLLQSEPLGYGGSFNVNKDPPDSPDTTINDFSVIGNVFSYFSSDTTSGDTVATGNDWAAHNHYFTGTAASPGTDTTTSAGESDVFTSPGVGNFVPKAGGALVTRVDRSTTVLFDVLNNARDSLTATGAYASAAETGAIVPNIPVLTDIERNIQFNVPFSADIPNSGDALDTLTITDPTHAPVGLAASVVAGVGRVSGTPTPS